MVRIVRPDIGINEINNILYWLGMTTYFLLTPRTETTFVILYVVIIKLIVGEGAANSRERP